MSQNIFDKALELRNVADGAETATASETGIALAVRFLPTCDWVIFVTTLGVVATETYVFTLEVSDLVGGTYTAIARHVWPIAHGPGEAHVPINGDLAAWQDTDSAFVRVTATLGGTTPTITYGSFLSKAADKMGMGMGPRNIVAV
jgi:hypothetical protein